VVFSFGVNRNQKLIIGILHLFGVLAMGRWLFTRALDRLA
jgi:hypothetical protein